MKIMWIRVAASTYHLPRLEKFVADTQEQMASAKVPRVDDCKIAFGPGRPTPRRGRAILLQDALLAPSGIAFRGTGPPIWHESKTNKPQQSPHEARRVRHNLIKLLRREAEAGSGPRSPRLRNPDQLTPGRALLTRPCKRLQRGQSWTPIRGQDCRPIDTYSSEPVLVGRITELRALRDQAHADADRAAALMEKADAVVTPETLRAFALAARAKLRNEDGTYRRDHLRALAQRVEVANGTDVRITGSKTELLRTMIAVAGVGSAEFRVRGFVPKWRTSDLCLGG